jgi:hypothetical protein
MNIVILYTLAWMWALLALPRRMSNRILEILFPMLRR